MYILNILTKVAFQKKKKNFISYRLEYISNIILSLIDTSIGERTPAYNVL